MALSPYNTQVRGAIALFRTRSLTIEMKIARQFAIVLAAVVLSLESTGESNRAGAATLTLTTDETTFFDSNPIVSTETFDRFGVTTFPGQSVTIDAVTYTDRGTSFWAIDDFTTSRALFSGDSLEPNVLSFGTNRWVDAIGFNLIPFGSLPGEEFFEFEFVVEEIGGKQTAFSSRPEPGVKNFFGFSSEAGIKGVTVFQPLGQGGRTNWSYDDVSRSAVKSIPEPSSFWGSILALSLLGAGAVCKRRETVKR